MAQITISGLAPIGALSDSYYIPVETASYTGHITASQILSYISASSLNSITVQSGSVVNNFNVGGTLTTGAIYAPSLTTTSDVVIGGNLIIAGAESLAGTGTFGSDLNVSGNVSAGRDIDIGGSIGTNTGTGNIVIGNASISGTATIGNVYATIKAPVQNYITTMSNVAFNYITVSANASVGTTLSVGGITTVGAAIVPTSNAAAVNLGSTGAWFNNIYGTAIHAQYADLAECYESDSQYPAGTVVVFGEETEITVSQTANDTTVAGVVSTNPAYLMNEGTGGLPIALQGRVPCQVTGTVKRGDLMVTSQIPGVAMTNNNPATGSVIGKALGNYSGTGVGVIEVVVGRL
jgi:hypothetical protein